MKTFFQTIMEHFKQIPIKEKEVLTYFIYMVKANGGMEAT